MKKPRYRFVYQDASDELVAEEADQLGNVILEQAGSKFWARLATSRPRDGHAGAEHLPAAEWLRRVHAEVVPEGEGFAHEGEQALKVVHQVGHTSRIKVAWTPAGLAAQRERNRREALEIKAWKLREQRQVGLEGIEL
jgi:hypothetical protein